MRQLLTLLFTTATIGFTQAQITTNFGVEGGLTSTTLRSINFAGTEESKYTPGGGFYVGGLVNIDAEKKVSYTTGLRFATTKSLEETKVLSVPGLVAKGNVTFSLIEIPVLFNYQFTKCKGWKFSAGPQFKFGLQGKAKYTFTGAAVPPVDESIEFGKDNGEYKRLQVAAAIGLTKQIKNNLGLSIGYHFGINDIDNTNLYETKFNSFRLGLQYNFN